MMLPKYCAMSPLPFASYFVHDNAPRRRFRCSAAPNAGSDGERSSRHHEWADDVSTQRLPLENDARHMYRNAGALKKMFHAGNSRNSHDTATGQLIRLRNARNVSCRQHTRCSGVTGAPAKCYAKNRYDATMAPARHVRHIQTRSAVTCNFGKGGITAKRQASPVS